MIKTHNKQKSKLNTLVSQRTGEIKGMLKAGRPIALTIFGESYHFIDFHTVNKILVKKDNQVYRVLIKHIDSIDFVN